MHASHEKVLGNFSPMTQVLKPAVGINLLIGGYKLVDKVLLRRS